MFGMGDRKKITREQAMASRPLRAVQADEAALPDSGLKITVRMRPNARWAWLLRTPQNATKSFEFDSLGAYVWSMCDGKTSLGQIIRRLAKRHQLNLRDAEVSTVQFMQMLVKKGLVAMELADDA